MQCNFLDYEVGDAESRLSILNELKACINRPNFDVEDLTCQFYWNCGWKNLIDDMSDEEIEILLKALLPVRQVNVNNEVTLNFLLNYLSDKHPELVLDFLIARIDRKNDTKDDNYEDVISDLVDKSLNVSSSLEQSESFKMYAKLLSKLPESRLSVLKIFHPNLFSIISSTASLESV